MSVNPSETPVRSRLEPAGAVQFGPFTLDLHTLELRRDGTPVAIAPQPARLLAALAARPGELVTREELRRAVWGDGTFVDFERGLNFCVLQARTALGDNARNPLYIETLPKRGYRFLGVRPPVAESPARPRWRLAVTALLAIAIVFGSRTPRSQALTSTVPAAHDAYLRGRVLWHQRATPAVQRAVGELRTAIRLDPRFVLAHLALAEALHSLAMRERLAARDAAAEIRRASDVALQLAPDHPGAHATAAMSRFWYEWDWEAAEESYRDAIRLDPREPGVLHDHGWLLITRGQFDQGIAQIRRAQELDPASPRANAHVAWAYIYTRRFDDAIAEARRALELDPEFEEAYRCLEHAYLLSGDRAKAAEIRARRGVTPGAGDRRDPYANAVDRLRLGDEDGAMRWLTIAKNERQTAFALAGVDPKLEPLHGDARFVRLVESAGLRVLRPPIR